MERNPCLGLVQEVTQICSSFRSWGEALAQREDRAGRARSRGAPRPHRPPCATPWAPTAGWDPARAAFRTGAPALKPQRVSGGQHGLIDFETVTVKQFIKTRWICTGVLSTLRGPCLNECYSSRPATDAQSAVHKGGGCITAAGLLQGPPPPTSPVCLCLQ